ncbi:proteinase inhibitor [Buttiauxella ferragutiae ATCC 51602]|uniref:Proteinase inhibitor n=2 Tax=Enterobacteriaceae TaxID=543 RepID=A0ABX2W7V7_9ENTR|nr:proteinase inhibitor [Buttiauxella ferragutiae ATCC 51602]
MRCKIFLSPLRPKVCASLQATREMCGTTRQQAMDYLIYLEAATAP